MTWYKEWFGEDYLRVYPHRNTEEAKHQIDFVQKILPLKKSDKILDLGCGNGRHANALAERGFTINCLDLSMILLRLARKNQSDDSRLNFIRADMRNMPFCSVFDKVLSFFTTFGYFESSAENLRTLLSIEQSLRPGGIFLQDYVNKSYVVNNVVPRDERDEAGFRIIQERNYNRDAERIEKKITIYSDGETREYFESVRLYTLQEMEALLAKTDLVLERTYGDFDGQPFSDKSPRLILIGKRRSTH